MNWVKLSNFMVKKRVAINPNKFLNEEFDLYSIPAYDLHVPEERIGEEIGSSKKLVFENDILLSRIVPHIRRAWVVKRSNGNRQIASSEWIVFQSNEIVPDYLRYFFLSDVFHPQLMQTIAGVGGSLLRARPEQVARIKIPLPPLETQKRIVAVLDRAQALIDRRKQQLALMDELTQSLFYDMFGDPVTNPMGWEMKPLQELIHKDSNISYGIVQPGDDTPHGVPILRPVDLRNGFPSIENLKRTTPEIDSQYKKTRLKGNEILISVRGTTGDTLITNNSLAGCNITRGLAIIRTSEANLIYLNGYFKTSLGQRYISENTKGATLRQINLKDLRTMPIMYPPIEFQKNFDKHLQKIETQKQAMTRSLRQLEDNFNALMQRAFKGEL